MKRWSLVVVVAVVACGDDDFSGYHDAAVMHDAPVDQTMQIVPDAKPDAATVTPGACNLLTQAGCAVGEKCTWLVDALSPAYVGHIGCAPTGTAVAGNTCQFGAPGATGFDNCATGLVCSDYRGGTGTCKAICDQQGGSPACGSTTVCVTYDGLFTTGVTAPPAAGVCDLGCDPLADNDFDGSGSLTKTSSACGSDVTRGCYGYPSYGTPPVTSWSCTSDINYLESQPLGLRHRVQCTETNNCADPGPTLYTNSCNQGYLPLLIERTFVSTAICVAMCKPLNCYAGNCGTNDLNRLGEAPHRCMNPDRLGTFDTSADGEHCQFLWYRERDDQGTFLPSQKSDTVGFCFDHSKYLYDSDGDNQPDTPLPACSSLQNGFGSGALPSDPNYWGAADLGCVDTANAGVHAATGKPHPPKWFDELRPLYRRSIHP